MTPVSVTLPEDACVAQAAAIMAYEGIHRLPVIGASHEVVGLISSLDVMRWIARRSGYVVPRTTRRQRG
jgi:CBS domain-containing protein